MEDKNLRNVRQDDHTERPDTVLRSLSEVFDGRADMADRNSARFNNAIDDRQARSHEGATEAFPDAGRYDPFNQLEEGDLEIIEHRLATAIDRRRRAGENVSDDDFRKHFERITDERIEEKRKALEHTEISDEYETTPFYRRAVAEFDPDDTRPQLAEFWVFRDPEYERDGYF